MACRDRIGCAWSDDAGPDCGPFDLEVSLVRLQAYLTFSSRIIVEEGRGRRSDLCVITHVLDLKVST